MPEPVPVKNCVAALNSILADKGLLSISTATILENTVNHLEKIENPASPDKSGVRKIDQLKAILDSQEKNKGWTNIGNMIKKGEDSLILDIPDNGIGFFFDSTGDKFLGIVNWKE
ncbi:MAG: hypothetical protein ABSF21_00080 [Dehalococcoidia bacterium]|jgi:hypothetical protein